MNPYDDHASRNLDDLDKDNLKAGRITKDALNEAVRRLRDIDGFDVEYLGVGMVASVADRMLADELNDMFKASRRSK